MVDIQLEFSKKNLKQNFHVKTYFHWTHVYIFMCESNVLCP